MKTRKFIFITVEGSRYQIDLRYLELLDAIMKNGSVVRASEEVGITDKTARSRLRKLERLLHENVVTSTKGGAIRGETKLTDHGRKVIGEYYAESSSTRVLADIPERKETRRQLVFQAALLDQVRSAVIATNLDFQIIYWNKFAEHMYQYTKHEAIGKQNLIIPESEAKLVAEIKRHALENGFWEGDMNHRRKDGSIFLAHVVVSLINDKYDEPLGIVGICTDISERKRS